uniref:Nucleoporin NUP53 n=1 Tax=Parastrongyloides trichosuri TaxID=131310 RepID=A0A0N4Z330_PARTI
MNARNIIIEDYNPWAPQLNTSDSGNPRHSMNNISFNSYRNNSNYEKPYDKKLTPINYGSIFRPKYKCSRPSLISVMENPSKYSFEEKSSYYSDFDADMYDDDKDVNDNYSNDNYFTSAAPDFLFGPLSSRVPKRRPILNVDNEDIPKRNTVVTFDLGNDSKDNGKDKSIAPPLRQLRDSYVYHSIARSPVRSSKDNDVAKYSHMSDEEFELNCWLVVFGLSNESEKFVLEYLNERFGNIKVVARKKGINYIYVRMSNPTQVKRAHDSHIYYYLDKEMIGFSKPITFKFLNDDEFKFETFVDVKKEKEKVNVPKKLDIRIVPMTKPEPVYETKPSENGLFSKLWSFVND